jgi:hypothetical protein
VIGKSAMRRFLLIRISAAALPVRSCLMTRRVNDAAVNRKGCDRDYNTRKELAEAAENQNIVEFGHGLPRKAPARESRGSKSMRLNPSPTRDQTGKS